MTNRHRPFRQWAPNLYRAFLFFAFVNAAMGLNFLILTPAVDPFGIPKTVSGLVFLAAGFAQIVTMHVSQHLTTQRFAMASAVAVMSAWGGILFAATFVEKATSLQLPIVVLGLAYLGLSLLYKTPRKDRP